MVTTGASFIQADIEFGVVEVKVLAGQRKPGLIDALLGAEQHTTPADGGLADAECGKARSLGLHSHYVVDAMGKRLVWLSINTDRGEITTMGERRCSVARTVRHTADHTGRPPWFPTWTGGHARRRHLQLRHRRARTLPHFNVVVWSPREPGIVQAHPLHAVDPDTPLAGIDVRIEGDDVVEHGPCSDTDAEFLQPRLRTPDALTLWRAAPGREQPLRDLLTFLPFLPDVDASKPVRSNSAPVTLSSTASRQTGEPT